MLQKPEIFYANREVKMIKYHHDVEQGTDEWHELRNGIITASEAKQFITNTGKLATNDKARKSIYELAAQRISGVTEPTYISDDMLRGMDEEADAIEYYEKNRTDVDITGIVINDDLGFPVGYSPDALVGNVGLLEVKCPRQKAHIQTMVTYTVPDEYKWQLQQGLFVTGRKWIDYVSHHAGLPMVIIRVIPDDEMQDKLKEALICSEEQVKDIVKKYNDMLLNPNEYRLIATERKQKEEIII